MAKLAQRGRSFSKIASLFLWRPELCYTAAHEPHFLRHAGRLPRLAGSLPELSLTGYWLGERAFDVAIRADTADPAFAALLDASRQLDLVISFVEGQ